MTEVMLLSLLGLVIVILITRFFISPSRSFCKKMAAWASVLQSMPSLVEDANEQILWQSEKKHYPRYVNRVGFNLYFKPGFQFFLRGMSRLTELNLALIALSKQFRINWDDGFLSMVQHCHDHNRHCLTVLIQALQQQHLDEVHLEKLDEFDDIVELESHVNDQPSLDLRVADQSALQCVRYLKDVRETILSLIFAMPFQKQEA